MHTSMSASSSRASWMHWRTVNVRPLKNAPNARRVERELWRLVARICDTLICRLRKFKGSETHLVREIGWNSPRQLRRCVEVEFGEYPGLDGVEVCFLGVLDSGDQNARQAHGGREVDKARDRGNEERPEDYLGSRARLRI